MSDDDKTPAPLSPLSDEAVRDLARDIVTNRVFITWKVEESQMCFLALALAPPDKLPQNIGAVYEYYSEAGDRSINGLPMFFSARFVAVESMPAVVEEVRRMQVALGITEEAHG